MTGIVITTLHVVNAVKIVTQNESSCDFSVGRWWRIRIDVGYSYQLMIVEIEVDLVLLQRDQHLVGSRSGPRRSIVILQSGRGTSQNALGGCHLNDCFDGSIGRGA